MWINYSERYKELEAKFSMKNDCCFDDSGIRVCLLPFYSDYVSSPTDLHDKIIKENISFTYPVFIPHRKFKNSQAILLLHGLNERKWNKYLTWAEYLCKETNKPVILFPIAFHINRSPLAWSNPREMDPLLNLRRMKNGKDRYLTFVNVALSERISEQPLRFYNSGRQSLNDVNKLVKSIKEGKNLLFEEDTHIDIFAYSIGAFLSQILLMTNYENLFSDSRLFMFCGGSIFNEMFGKSRSIMDESAYEKLMDYYLHDFTKQAACENDKVFRCFYSMIAPEWNKEKRETFFSGLGDRLSGISLKKDTVIHYHGIKKALGDEYTGSHISLLDFDYDYSHEVPFPTVGKINTDVVNQSFNQIFSTAAEFLG